MQASQPGPFSRQNLGDDGSFGNDTTASGRFDVATYGTYAEAQRAVDTLSDRRFEVRKLAIVADGLRFVEDITGRRGYAKAAAGGALSGAMTGALFGWLFGLFSWVDPLVSALALALYGLVIGAVIGALIGLLSHALSGGRRDFSSVGTMQANRYVVVAEDADAAERARAELATSGVSTRS